MGWLPSSIPSLEIRGLSSPSFHPKDFSELNLLPLWPRDSRGESIRIGRAPIAKWDQYLEITLTLCLRNEFWVRD